MPLMEKVTDLSAAKGKGHWPLYLQVGELAPEEVRWFYKPEAEKTWTPFDGYDSLRYDLRPIKSSVILHYVQVRWSNVTLRLVIY